MGRIKKPGKSQQCRCCLKEVGLKELWTEYYIGDEREVYGEMVNDCFAIPWEPLFGKTEHICDRCIDRLRDAVSFKREILNSTQLLEEQVKNENKLSVKQEEESDPEMETEYLSVDYMDDDEDKDKTLLDIKIEQDSKSLSRVKEEASQSRSGKRYTEDDIKKCIDAVTTGKMSQTKASIVYHVPRKTIRTALANMPIQPGAVTRTRDGPALRKRQDNLDNLIRFTNATPFKDVRRGHVCYFCSSEHDAADLKIHTIQEHLRLLEHDVMKIKVLSDKSIKLDITDLTCEICGDRLKTLEAAFAHLKMEHDVAIHADSKDHLVPFKFEGNTLICVVCEKEFSSFKLLNDHINLEHYKNYECGTCGRGFINKRSLQSHGYLHKTGVFPCQYCPEVFNVHVRRVYHEKYVHLNKKKRNKCRYCDEKFLDIVQKKKHESDAHGVARQIYSCKSCEKYYCSKKSLNRHTEGVHLKLRPYQCQECGTTFSRISILKTHMLKHSGEKLFQCDVCQKFYGRKSVLREHLRIHTNDRRYKCELCGKRFVQKCSWRGHMRNKHGVHV